MPECCPEFMFREGGISGAGNTAELPFLIEVYLPVIPVDSGRVRVHADPGKLVGFFGENAGQAQNLL
jgi:hypothetical protein